MFQYMFPDSEVAAQFSLGKSKCRYMLLSGIAPHFKSILKKDINTSSFYSVSFDESLNSVIQKCQMDVNIRYWNDSTNKVETRYGTSNHLENDLVDVGAATKDLLRKVEVTAERKRKFKGECKKVILDVLTKLSERTPLRFSIIRHASAIVPGNMVHVSEICSKRFSNLTDRLYSLNKIKASVADSAKGQFDELLKSVKFEYKTEFLKFDYKKDRLDVFLGSYISGEKKFCDLWFICKTLFILSHGQSFTERGFSVNREVLDDNMKELSLVSQRTVYDTLHSNQKVPLHEFSITAELRKSCRLAYQQYKLEQAKINESNAKTDKNLKRKLKMDEIDNVKKQKLILEKAISALREGIITETLAADKSQDLSNTAKAASFCRTLKEKEKTLSEIDTIRTKLEEEYKHL